MHVSQDTMFHYSQGQEALQRRSNDNMLQAACEQEVMGVTWVTPRQVELGLGLPPCHAHNVRVSQAGSVIQRDVKVWSGPGRHACVSHVYQPSHSFALAGGNDGGVPLVIALTRVARPTADYA